jgi:hypothetical protein
VPKPFLAPMASDTFTPAKWQSVTDQSVTDQIPVYLCSSPERRWLSCLWQSAR